MYKNFFSLDEINNDERPEWLDRRIILLTKSGSKANGTDTETSDNDYQGVCIPPKEYFLSFQAFNQFNTTGSKNYKSSKDDNDVTIFHISKFVMDAIKGRPNNIELLFTRPEDIIHMNKYGEELISHKNEFISKAVKDRFSNYANSQREKMMIKKANGTGRQELIQQFGYDTKFFMHSARIFLSAIEIISTGNFSTYRINDRKFLLDCRNGYYTESQALDILAELYDKLNSLYETSTIPEVPDSNKIIKWLVDLNEKALMEKW